MGQLNVLILAPYPQKAAPSQRFRFEHFFKFMEEMKLTYDFSSFLSEKAWAMAYQRGNFIHKAFYVFRGYLSRLITLFTLNRYDFIFIHRELTPFGPPIFEWLIARVFRKKVIYDFDDAIWMADQRQENFLWKTLKWRSKVASICKLSWKVSVGNQYLGRFASQYCNNVVLMPTIVDTWVHTPPSHQERPMPVIGWTGSHSTLFYLETILPALTLLQERFEFEFLVIANKNPNLPLKHFRFVPWKEETEIEDLSVIDIGVMPLEDTEWSKGKCGFKLIQYLSLGVPAVASPVGVNNEIIQEDLNGYFARSTEEWVSRLSILLRDYQKRTALGNNGRLLIEEKYSVNSQKQTFFNLFRGS